MNWLDLQQKYPNGISFIILKNKPDILQHFEGFEWFLLVTYRYCHV